MTKPCKIDLPTVKGMLKSMGLEIPEEIKFPTFPDVSEKLLELLSNKDNKYEIDWKQPFKEFNGLEWPCQYLVWGVFEDIGKWMYQFTTDLVTTIGELGMKIGNGLAKAYKESIKNLQQLGASISKQWHELTSKADNDKQFLDKLWDAIEPMLWVVIKPILKILLYPIVEAIKYYKSMPCYKDKCPE